MSTLFDSLMPREQAALIKFFRLDRTSSELSGILNTKGTNLKVEGDHVLGLAISRGVAHNVLSTIFPRASNGTNDATLMVSCFGSNEFIGHFVQNILFLAPEEGGSSAAAAAAAAAGADKSIHRNNHDLADLFEALLAIATRMNEPSFVSVAETIVADYIRRVCTWILDNNVDTDSDASSSSSSDDDKSKSNGGNNNNSDRIEAMQRRCFFAKSIASRDDIVKALKTAQKKFAAKEARKRHAAAALRATMSMSPDEYHEWCETARSPKEAQSSARRAAAADAAASSQAQAGGLKDGDCASSVPPPPPPPPPAGGQHPIVKIDFCTRSGVCCSVFIRPCCSSEPQHCVCDPALPPHLPHAGKILAERASKAQAVKRACIARWSCCQAVIIDSTPAGAAANYDLKPHLDKCSPSWHAAAPRAAF